MPENSFPQVPQTSRPIPHTLDDLQSNRQLFRDSKNSATRSFGERLETLQSGREQGAMAHQDFVDQLHELSADATEAFTDGRNLSDGDHLRIQDDVKVLFNCFEPQLEMRDIEAQFRAARRTVVASPEQWVAAARGSPTAGIDLARVTEHGLTVAILAAIQGDAAAIAAMRIDGVDLNAFGAWAMTPAHYASMLGHPAVIAELRAAGADLNAANSDGMTPAHVAAQWGNHTALAALHEAGVDLNAANGDGVTPARIAVEAGRATALTALYVAGVNLNAADGEGRTLAHLAAEYGHVDLIQVLHELKVNLTVYDYDDVTPTHVAAAYGRSDVIQKLGELGANLGAYASNGNTPAHVAAEHGRANVIKMLQEFNVNLDAPNPYNRATPTDIAHKHGQTEVIEALQVVSANLGVSHSRRDSPTKSALPHPGPRTPVPPPRRDRGDNADRCNRSTSPPRNSPLANGIGGMERSRITRGDCDVRCADRTATSNARSSNCSDGSSGKTSCGPKRSRRCSICSRSVEPTISTHTST